MSTWNIYGIRNSETVTLATVHDPEYHGEWMETEYVTVTVKSPTPITFKYGDYLIYRGARFEISYDPDFIKKARSGSYGEGFTYDNVRFYPVSKRTEEIAFKDVVLYNSSDPANAIVYSSMGTFAFFASSVEDLADRIQANLNREYPGEWKVYTPNRSRSEQRIGQYAAWATYYMGNEYTGKTDVNIECQNLSCWDAVKLAYTSFGLSFYAKAKNIIIGGKPIVADYGFEYGKGNGLYQIERTHDESQRIVTKLFAYGSEKNLPLNYYANIVKQVRIPIYHKTKREILQGNPELVFWVNKEFTTSLRKAFGPNYELKVTYGNITARLGVAGNTYTYAEEQEDSTLDHTTEYMTLWALSSDSAATALYSAITQNAYVYVTGVNINKMPSDFIYTPSTYSYDAALSINRLMLPGFPLQSLYAWVKANGATAYNDSTGQATWHGYTAIFSKDASDPWIKSLKAATIGVREGTVEFDGSGDEKDIYPTIEGTGFDEVDYSEQIGDNGHIDEEQTFAFRPKQTSGDGDIEWDYSGETVSISMKDGYCTGREFEVAEAKFDTDTHLWNLTLKRKKDDSLGVYFPYNAGAGNLYQIMAGDHFVVLGIPLPSSYVTNAASKLLEEALKHLAAIDHQQYTYIPRIDEIEMQRQDDLAAASQGTITSIHDTICAGMQMQIDDDDLDVHYSPFIDTITIKEHGNNGVPTYDVVLRDDKDLTLQQKIQSQINGGKDAMIDLLGGFDDGRYLSKVTDDTAQGFITFVKGMQVGDRFVPGLLGEGGVFRKESDGTTYIEADKLYIRMKAYFDTVEIRRWYHSSGNRMATNAGMKCCRVEWRDSSGNVLEQTTANMASVAYFRCYFRGTDGDQKVTNDFLVGDLAYCKVTNVESSSSLYQHGFWRVVIGRNAGTGTTVEGEYYIDLSNAHDANGDPVMTNVTVSGSTYSVLSFQSGSDFPVAEDDIVQLGNINDTSRRGAIIEFVSGADAPAYQIFQDLGATLSNPYSLNNKCFVHLGYDSQYHTAKVFIGDPNETTYLKYHHVNGVPELKIKAKVEFTSPTTGTDTDLETFANAVVNEMADLQSQIDGEIDTWFYEGTPTLNNAPASSWTTSTVKDRHLGDLYYDIGTGQTAGFAYRFIKDANNVYQWQYIEDTAITEALAAASRAQDTADSKRRVFVAQPTDAQAYDVGDLWVNATYNSGGVSYNNDVLRCMTAKAAGASFSISHWMLASKYTDDTKFNNYINAILNGSGATGDSATAAAAQKAIIDAVGGATVVDGGLLLTSLIAMRKYNGSGDRTDVRNYTTYAGISGEYDSTVYGGGLAAWYGGAMIDKYNPTTQQYDVQNGAKIGFRFDGSGYVAGGAIAWDSTGLTVANISSLVASSSIKIGVGANLSDVLTQATADQRYVTIDFFNAIFAIYRGNDRVTPNANTGNIDAIKALVGLYTDQYLSALGQDSGGGGGGVTLNQPLEAINNAGLSAPSGSGILLVYSNGVWKYSSNTSIFTTGITIQGNATAAGYFSANSFIKTGGTSQQILLADGSVMSVSDIPTGIGAATTSTLGLVKVANGYGQSIAIQSTGQNTSRNYGLQIDSDGKAFVYVPWEVPTLISAFTNDAGYTTNIGTVTGISIGGSTPYSPSNGVVSLPAYPSDTKNTAGAMAYQNTKLYLIGSTSYDVANAQTYTNSGCYIGADNCLYSNGSKVMTAASGYLPVTGGTLTGSLTVSGNFAYRSPSIRIVNSYTDEYASAFECYHTNCATTRWVGGLIAGKEGSTNNAYTINFGYRSYGGTSNFIGIGFWANDNILTIKADRTATFISSVTASSFVKSGGTSSQFLKADGSVDTTLYLPLTGGTLTGSSNLLNLQSPNTNSWIYYKIKVNGSPANAASCGYYSGLAFVANERGTYARIGVADDGTPQYWPNSSGSNIHTLYHSGNLSKGSLCSYIFLPGEQNPHVASNGIISLPALPTAGGTLDGSLQIYSTGNSWSEGVRMHLASNGWCGVVMCGSDNTGSSGTSAKTWSMHNHDGSFYLANNGSDTFTYGLSWVSGEVYFKADSFKVNNFKYVETASYSSFTSNNRNIMFEIGTANAIYGKAFTPTSDIRKKDITDYINLNLTVISQAPIFNFTWKDCPGTRPSVGTSAQYWEKVLPYAVSEAPDGYLAMDYGATALAAAVMTARKVEEHEQRIAELERENKVLWNMIATLKAS